MAQIIEKQNADLLEFKDKHSTEMLYNSDELMYNLNLSSISTKQNYLDDDIEVFMYYQK